MDYKWPRNKFVKTPTITRLLQQRAMECFLKPKIMLPLKLPWTAPAFLSMTATAKGAI
jgi:hypothetical protein